MTNIDEERAVFKKEMNEEMEAFRKTYNKSVKAYKSTQGHKKLWNRFLEIIETDDFQKTVDELRIKFNIPKAGIKTKDRLTHNCLNKYHSVIPFGSIDYIEKIKEFTEEIEKLCKKYHLHSLEWGQIIETYLIYNKTEQLYDFNSHNLCLLRDLVAEKSNTGLEKTRSSGMMDNFEKDDDLTYPIAIRISPYAKKADIVDYINKIYMLEIKPLQEKYINKNIKIKNTININQPKQKLKQYIFKNRGKAGKKIKRITSDIYDNKLKEYKEIQQGLLEEMQRHSIADESYYLAVNQVLSLSQRASEIFESSEPNEKRQLLNYLLQNCRLNERNLLFELKKPFDALVKYNKCPEMLRR